MDRAGGKNNLFVQTNAQTNGSHKFSQRLKPYFELCAYINNAWWFLRSLWASLFNDKEERETDWSALCSLYHWWHAGLPWSIFTWLSMFRPITPHAIRCLSVDTPTLRHIATATLARLTLPLQATRAPPSSIFGIRHSGHVDLSTM